MDAAGRDGVLSGVCFSLIFCSDQTDLEVVDGMPERMANSLAGNLQTLPGVLWLAVVVQLNRAWRNAIHL